MTEPKIIAWAAIAGGEDTKAGQYRMAVGGSTISSAKAKASAAGCFAESWPGVKMRVCIASAIREGD